MAIGIDPESVFEDEDNYSHDVVSQNSIGKVQKAFTVIDTASQDLGITSNHHSENQNTWGKNSLLGSSMVLTTSNGAPIQGGKP